jgi:hypothetical protein
MRRTIVLVLVLLAAGCGGGGDGGGKTLSKAGYVAALNAACDEANAAFSKIGAGNQASFKEHGDEIVKAAEKANADFHAAKAPAELKAQETIFLDSADKIVEDIKAMADAATAGSQSKFEAAYRSLQTHGSANDAAAATIGATACTGGA